MTKQKKDWCEGALTETTLPLKGKFIRCPVCNKRLKPKAVYALAPVKWLDAQPICYIVPDHKEK